MYDFAGKRWWFFLFSFLMVVPGTISLMIPPSLKAGIDFTSGTQFTVEFESPVDAADLRSALNELGQTDSRVQQTDSGRFVVRTDDLEAGADPAPPATAVLGPQPAPEPAGSPRAQLEADLRERFGPMVNTDGIAADPESGNPVGFQDFSSVSESISRDIGRNAAIAVAAAAVAILLYISWVFRQVPKPVRYGVAAVVALLHDALFVLGAFSIFGKLFDTDINAMFITGILTVIGFSVHDTIVVFDRVREKLTEDPGLDIEVAVNSSLTETLARSITTSLTLLFTVAALLLLGGEGIRSFLIVLLIGVTAGTYSSIAIASQVLVAWEKGDIPRFYRRIRGGGGELPVEAA